MRRFLLLLVGLAAVTSSIAQCTSNRYKDVTFANVTTTSGVKFGTAPTYLNISQDLYLDFYEPSGDTLQARPLIVYAFGGGFLIGTRNQPPIPAYCTYLAQCGYAVASIDYRIGFNTLDGTSAERAVYRGAQDLRAAVRFLCQRYSQYRIDTQAIFLTGSSAGCFSALHSCFMEPGDIPTSVHGTTLEPSDLGCIDCSGNSDNNQRMPLIRGIINHWGAILDTTFIRPTIKDNVPIITFHGDGDNAVPYVTGHPFSYPIFPVVYGARPIHRRLGNLGVKNELHTLVGFGHEPWLLNPELKDTCYKYTKPFLYSILVPKPLTIHGDSTVCLNDRGSYTVEIRSGSHYCWDVTGGTLVSNTGNSITVQWNSTGPHTISVREITRNDVNGDLAYFTVNVINRPIAAFGVSVLHSVVAVTDSSVGAINWNYNMGNNQTRNSPSFSYDYHNESTYSIRLIVSNGFCADTTSRIVQTDTCPVASFHYRVSNDTVYFIADSSNGVQFHWRFGDGDSTDGRATYHVYNRGGNYLVYLAVSSARACTQSVALIVPYSAPNGIEDITEEQMKLIPNPAHGSVFIDCIGCEVTIYDLLGRVVWTDYELQNKNIDISFLNNGIYNVRLRCKNNLMTRRLMVQ